MQATYTDFSYIGDGAAHGEWAEIGFYSSSNYTFTLQHDAFTFCGSGRTTGYNMSAGSTLHIDYNSWSNTLGAFGNIIVPAGTTMTSGARTITYNVFDKRWNDGDGNCNQGMGSDNIAFTGNYFGAGNCVPSAYSSANAPAMTDNFFRLGVSDTVELYGNLTGGYFFNDVTAADNWHASAMDSAMSATQSGFVMESPDDWTSDSGEMTVGWSSSPSYSTTFKNAILVPSKTGQGTMELASFTNVTPSGANTNILSLLHNTWVGRTGEGMFQTNESGAQLAALAALKSNLAWSTGGGYCKVSTITGTGALFQNTVSAADYNSADSHLIQNAVSANCSTTCPNNACVKQGNGYVGNWSSTPGAHDVAASPYLADPLLRNVALWDTRYLGHAAATQWTAGLGTVAYGAQVSDSHTGYWGGAAINFRCVYATGCITSTANSEPNVGSAWRTYWEFASLYDLRTAIPAGAAYTNVAIGCSGCTAVQALVKWVQRGFTPQNPALWCAGHDGEAIGAVPFCASGKLMLGTFGPM